MNLVEIILQSSHTYYVVADIAISQEDENVINENIEEEWAKY